MKIIHLIWQLLLWQWVLQFPLCILIQALRVQLTFDLWTSFR